MFSIPSHVSSSQPGKTILEAYQHTFNHGGLFPAYCPLSKAPSPNNSLKPYRLARTQSHKRNKNADKASAAPKSRAGAIYGPAVSSQMERKEIIDTQGTRQAIRMIWRCCTGVEYFIAWLKLDIGISQERKLHRLQTGSWRRCGSLQIQRVAQSLEKLATIQCLGAVILAYQVHSHWSLGMYDLMTMNQIQSHGGEDRELRSWLLCIAQEGQLRNM